MNILLVVRWPVGGIRTYFRYIYTQAIFSDYRFTIIGPDIEFSGFIDDYFNKDRVTYISCDDDNKKFMSAIRKQVRNGGFDLVHSHGYSAGALTALALALTPIKHIMTAHDVYRSEQFKGFKGKLELMALNLVYASLTGVLTVGQDCKSNFRQHMPAVPKVRISNIDHGVDVVRFSGAMHRDLHAELGLDADRKVLGFFGRFMPQKGFIDIVDAINQLAQELPSSEMPQVVTFGWGGYVREYFQRIERLGLAEYFVQMPFTDDVPSAIKGVDVVLMPSHWEACGLLAMEVLAAGKPLIGTDCLGLRCVLEGTPAHVVEVGDSGALAEAIKSQMSADSSKFANYQEIALERFNMQRPAQELYKYYQKLLGTSS